MPDAAPGAGGGHGAGDPQGGLAAVRGDDDAVVPVHAARDAERLGNGLFDGEPGRERGRRAGTAARGDELRGGEQPRGEHGRAIERAGESLRQILERGPLATETALEYAAQIAEALEAAHERGIVHRDLKPANIMVTPSGGVKVLDFGLAAVMNDATPTSADPANSPTLTIKATQAGVILVTAGYMSPEQARGRQVDKRTDIWAFGVVLYEMITGRRLFEGEDLTERFWPATFQVVGSATTTA